MNKILISLLMVFLVSSCKKSDNLTVFKQISPQQNASNDIAKYLGLQEVKILPAASNAQVFSKEEALKFIQQHQLTGYFINHHRVASKEAAVGDDAGVEIFGTDARPHDPYATHGGGGTDWWGLNGMSVTFNWGYDPNGNIVTSDWSATMIGVFLFIGYEYKSTSKTVDENGVIHYTVAGYQTYGLTVEGVGLITGRQSVRIHGTYDTKTGASTTHYTPGTD